MTNLARLLSSLVISPTASNITNRLFIPNQIVRYIHKPNIKKPIPGFGKSYRRIVHFPEEYTVEPLDVTNLAGRDPVTGRIVAKGIGGGIKHKYHWIQWVRDGPTEGPPKEERVIQVLEDGCRTAHIALVAEGSQLKYILATENMKAGDLLKTSRHLPRIPVRAKEGDAYVLGALPTGSQVHCIEKEPGRGGLYIHAAGTYGTILRKQDDRIIVQMPSKREFSFSPHCMAVLGRLSNVEHGSTPIGSAQRNRWLGNRPRSGLWQRKDGRHGRKIRPPKPVKLIEKLGTYRPQPTQLTIKLPNSRTEQILERTVGKLKGNTR